MTLLIAAALAWTPHFPIVENVRINGQGPFRLVADTGGETSMLRPLIAARAGLRPAYRVEIVSIAGSTLEAAATANTRLAGRDFDGVEWVLTAPAALPDHIDGILGQNVLSQLDYLIDSVRGRLIADPDGAVRRTLRGHTARFRTVTGRMAVTARVGGAKACLVFDSGASASVLFRTPPGWIATGTGELETAAGTRSARTGHVEARVGSWKGTLAVAVAEADPRHGRDGLLAAGAFPWVYVSNRGSEVILGESAR